MGMYTELVLKCQIKENDLYHGKQRWVAYERGCENGNVYRISVEVSD
nr:MAG TPA: hypothetical protein [Caudoviricetes sp.]